ncbi:MAG: ABC transporter permease, partial [Ruminiclostridium sp.]
EDVNSAMMPMSFVTIIAFYLPYSTFMNPDSTVARVASLIPLSSPFSVPSRLLSTDVPLWEIATSLLILIASIVLIGTISIKLYSFAVLHYGDRLKLSTLFKISKENKA